MNRYVRGSWIEFGKVASGIFSCTLWKEQCPSIKKVNQRRIGQLSALNVGITWDLNTPCKQNAKIFNVTAGGTHNNHWAWNVDYSN
jgi:hypothetical protein